MYLTISNSRLAYLFTFLILILKPNDGEFFNTSFTPEISENENAVINVTNMLISKTTKRIGKD